MANTLLTDRDRELLGVLDWTPATLTQLLHASQTFAEPYTNLAYLGRRMQKLAEAGWVHSWHYATTSPGAVLYYKLTANGFRELHGPATTLPEKSFFAPVSMSLQNHTRLLADVVIHTRVAAHRHGIRVADFRRENQVRLHLGDEQHQPDATWQLVAPTGRRFNFLFEIDNSTEPLASPQDRESIERTIGFYERLQESLFAGWRNNRTGEPRRFRLVFFTRSVERSYHILSLARQVRTHPDRRLVYAITTAEYLAENDALRMPCFLDHEGRWQSLVNCHPTSQFRRTPVRLTVAHSPTF